MMLSAWSGTWLASLSASVFSKLGPDANVWSPSFGPIVVVESGASEETRSRAGPVEGPAGDGLARKVARPSGAAAPAPPAPPVPGRPRLSRTDAPPGAGRPLRG